jgi:hypothetical protein
MQKDTEASRQKIRQPAGTILKASGNAEAEAVSAYLSAL